VIDGFVAAEATSDRAVHVRLIGSEIAGSIGVAENHLADLAGGHAFDLDGTRFAAALDKGNDLPLISIRALFLPAVFGMQDPGRATFNVALEGLVYLDGLAFPAEWARAAFVHRLADTMPR
jgi:hypothetical protein